MKEERRGRAKGRIAIAVCVLYLAATVGATVYSQAVYIASLPRVTLTRAEGGVVPKECVEQNGYESCVNAVEQSEGPWGKRYLIKKVSVICTELENGDMQIWEEFGAVREPIVLSADVPVLINGMEVRLF